MKLISVKIKNFRLLRDLQLDFSTDNVKKLTVFRAPNETGKTTIVRALRWGLYGDNALPNKGAGWRMHPIDWNKEESLNVDISVSIEFEVQKIITMGQRKVESQQQYRITRSVREVLEEHKDKWRKTDASVKLWQIDESGSTPIKPPEAIIREELPIELRDIFFTDGDKAMDFIEADINVRTKRQRVEDAIRSLLGIGILQRTIDHVNNTSKVVNRKAKNLDDDGNLSLVTQKIDENEKDKEKQEKVINGFLGEFQTLEKLLKETSEQIDAALEKGNKEKLLEEKKRLIDRKTSLNTKLAKLKKEHSRIFENVELAKHLLAPALKDSNSILKKLELDGQIPHTTIPVLKTRLAQKLCICGESLDPNSATDKERIKHIEHMIEANQGADELQKVMTALFFKGQDLTDSPSNWKKEFGDIVRQREDLYEDIVDTGKEIKALEASIDQLPDTNIKELRGMESEYQKKLRLKDNEIQDLQSTIRVIDNDIESLKAERDSLLKNQKKGHKIRTELTVIQDVLDILKRSYLHMTNEELKKVSNLMSEIFLKMIGADNTQRALVNSARITEEYDIIVEGPSGTRLDPDHDLNGASRRALTLAFILALTNVTEVEAPNIIDTPLGMMDGYVKTAVLKIAIEYSQQIILFLTHSEISGCEEIIGNSAGIIRTLSNTAHFPKMLLNDPQTSEKKVLVCECVHPDSCEVCSRRTELVEDEVLA